MKRLFTLAILALLTLAGAGCYNDNLEDMYPGTGGNCQFDSVRFSTTIQPIMNLSCAVAGCHDAASATAGINLSDYAGVQATVNSGRLIGSINHSSGFSPMPKNTDKLDDCKLLQIQKWVTDGAPNN